MNPIYKSHSKRTRVNHFEIELHPKNWTQFLEVQFFYVKTFKKSKRKDYLSF